MAVIVHLPGVLAPHAGGRSRVTVEAGPDVGSALAALFDGVGSRDDRAARCLLAVRDHGYTMKEVAAFLGVHYVTVSRALAQAETPRSGREMSECKT